MLINSCPTRSNDISNITENGGLFGHCDVVVTAFLLGCSRGDAGRRQDESRPAELPNDGACDFVTGDPDNAECFLKVFSVEQIKCGAPGSLKEAVPRSVSYFYRSRQQILGYLLMTILPYAERPF